MPPVVEIALRRLLIFLFFKLPAFQQNVPLIYHLLTSWNIENQAFIVNGTTIKFTINEVTLIIGMSNRRALVEWNGDSLDKKTAIDIKNKMKDTNPSNTPTDFVKIFI